jgi:hypothetical protein
MFQTTKQINRPKTMIFQTSYSFVSFFNIHTPVWDVENPSSGLGPKVSVPKPLSNCNWCFLILCSDLEQSMRLSIFSGLPPRLRIQINISSSAWGPSGASPELQDAASAISRTFNLFHPKK